MVTRVNAPPPAAGQAEAPPADGLGDFADLMQAAEQAEGIRPPPAEAPPAEQLPPDFAGEARELVEVAAELLLPFAAMRWGQDVADAYGPRQREAIAGAFGRVAQKRGWTIETLMAGYGAELALCAALAAPVLPIVMRRARTARQVEAAPPAEPLPAPPPAEPLQPAPPADDGRIR